MTYSPVDATNRLVASLTLTYTGIAMTSVGATLLLIARFGVGLATGSALAIQVIPSVLLAPFVGELISKFNPRRIAVLSSLLAAATVSCYPLAHRPWVAQLIALVTGICLLPGIPARMALRRLLIPESKQHVSSGRIVAGERMALVAGPLLAGLIAANYGYVYIFFCEAGLALLAAIPLTGVLVPKQERTQIVEPRRWTAPWTKAARLFVQDRLITEYTYTGVAYCVGIGIRRLALPAVAIGLHARVTAIPASGGWSQP